MKKVYSNMRKVIFCLLMIITSSLSSNAQTTLNDMGVYEFKSVVLYDSLNYQKLFEQSRVALSDIAGSNTNTKIGVDVMDKQAGTIIYKGEYYLGFHRVNMLCGYEVTADFTLKMQCKDNKAQYTIIVPSLHLYWSCNMSVNETVPIKYILPKYTYKGRLYYLKKSCLLFSNNLDNDIKKFYSVLIERTKQNIKEDF